MKNASSRNTFIKYCLGLDLGSSSIGWSIVELNENDEPIGAVNMGVRKFHGGRNLKTGESLSFARRNKRHSRRQRKRFLSREKKLLNMLKVLKLMPNDQKECRLMADCSHPSLRDRNIYYLRARATKMTLTPFELGRFFIAINKRRGFKSNRKGEQTDQTINTGIDELNKKIEQYASLGEYFAERIRNKKYVLDARITNDKVNNERLGLQTSRQMYEDEFNTVREAQQPHHTLTDRQWDELFNVIFYQRPLKEVERGRCTLYGAKHIEALTDEDIWVLRAYRADPRAQKLRIWEDINNLEIYFPDNDSSRRLTDEERRLLWQALSCNSSVTFSTIRSKILKLPQNVIFNLERAKNIKLLGMATELVLSKDKKLGKSWHELTDDDKSVIVEAIQGVQDDEKAIALIKKYGFTVEQAKAAIETKLEAGTARFCPTAIDEILTFIVSAPVDKQTNRYPTTTEALSALRGEKCHGRLLSHLDYYAKLMPEVGMHHQHRTVLEERMYGIIGNPTVHIALNQLRHLVNAIIERYGSPARVAIEVARDLKLTNAEKKSINKKNKANEALRKQFKAEAEKHGVNINDDYDADFKKYKLWCELDEDESNRRCIYSGKTITLSDLFSQSVNIEHIIPRAWSIDDSMNNLTISTRDINKLKGDMTPYEYFIKYDPNNLDAMLARVKKLPVEKQWRFLAQARSNFKDSDRWIGGLLNDTRYISKLARRYMQFICPDVRVSPGKLTAKARWQWLGESFIKNRDQDHRHHAIDSLIVALLDHKVVHLASRIAANDISGIAYKKTILPCPMDVQLIKHQVSTIMESMIVSHRIEHGVQGALHKETALGRRDKKHNNSSNFVVTHQQGEHVHKNVYEHGGVHHIDFWQRLSNEGSAEVTGVPVYMHEANLINGAKPKQTRPHPTSKFIMRLHKGDTIVVKEADNYIVAHVRKLSPSSSNKNLTYCSVNVPYKSNNTKPKTLQFSKLLAQNACKVYINILGEIRYHKHKRL